MSTAHGVSDHASRAKSATIGFGITLAAIAALAGIQFLLAPQIVAGVGRTDPDIYAWAVSQLRIHIAEFYAIVVAILAVYWLLSAVAVRGELLANKGENVTLLLSGLAFALAIAVASFFQVPEAFKWGCPILGVSDTFPPLPAGTYRFDGQTPCETFLRQAVPSLLLGLPTILLVASAVLRIVGSRRQ